MTTAEIKSDKGPSGTKMMSEMKPLEICRIVDDKYKSAHNGHIVMRTASTDQFEVIDLSNLRKDGCWESPTIVVMVEPWYGDILIKSRP